MARSVKLGDDLAKEICRENERQSRALEKSGNFGHARTSAVLAGETETTDLTDEEKAVWLDGFEGQMAAPGPEEGAFFDRRRKLGLGVGLDYAGNLVGGQAKRGE